MRLLHLIPVLVIISLVTATLKAAEPKALRREFLRAIASLAGGFALLGVLIYVLGKVL